MYYVHTTAKARGFFLFVGITFHQLFFFQIGDRKKKDMDPIYHNFYVVYQSRVMF